jgi:hypothetical protein
MAVARIGGTGVAWTNNNVTSPNVSVDCTGANFLFCFIAWRNNSGNTISSATYAGSPMTRFGTVYQSASPRMDVDIFYIDSPSSGSNNIVVTASSAIGGGGNDGVIYPHALSGVDLTTRFGTRQAFEASSPFTDLDITLSSAAGEMCIDIAFVNGNITTLTASGGGDQTAIGIVVASSVNNCNSSTKSGAASTGMGWDYTSTPALNAIEVGVPVKAAGAPAGSLLIRPRGMGGGIQGLTGGMNS